MFRYTLWIAAAIVVSVSAFSTQAMANFTVDGAEYQETWYDDFNDGVIDTAKWPVPTYITESATPPGTLAHTTTTKKTTTSADFSASFAGATEWAYLFRAQVPTTMINVSNRLGNIFRTDDIGLYAYKNSGSAWQLWAGNGYYTTNTFYYKSGDLNLNQFYEIAVHKEDGANLYDIYIDGVKVIDDVASNTYDGVEVPTKINIGHESSLGNFPGIYDYMYAGVPYEAPPETGNLTITKFFDCDNNGVKDYVDDNLLPGWEYHITGPAAYDQTLTTDALGEIKLTGLDPGDYTVTETVWKDHAITTGNQGVVIPIAGGDDKTELFGNLLNGDINQDGVVDSVDFTILKANYGLTPKTWVEGNLNPLEDNVVDSIDFTILKAYYGQGVPPGPGAVPEPATLTLLALLAVSLPKRGSLLVLRMRRK